MPEYSLVLSPSAIKVLKLLKRRDLILFSRISTAIDEIGVTPMEGKPLSGEFRGRYSWRVGSYRIIYKVVNEVLTIIIVDIGHRKGIYRR